MGPLVIPTPLPGLGSTVEAPCQQSKDQTPQCTKRKVPVYIVYTVISKYNQLLGIKGRGGCLVTKESKVHPKIDVKWEEDPRDKTSWIEYMGNSFYLHKLPHILKCSTL